MEFYLIHNVGAELTGTAGATAKLDFSSGTNYAANFRRQAVLVASCGASPVYAKIVGRGGSAPTVTSSNWHIQIPAGQTVLIRATREVDVYLLGTTAYTAQEIG